MIGLYKGILDFDLDQGTPFQAFAHLTLEGAAVYVHPQHGVLQPGEVAPHTVRDRLQILGRDHSSCRVVGDRSHETITHRG